MSKIVISSKFKRAFRKFTRRNPKLQAKIENVIIKLSEDILDPALGTHKLDGKLADLLSCSCGYDCRIIFAIEKEQEINETLIILLDIGTHDEVY
ncbi:MAG: type II toxin-antitoxin system mRNA interferase toxin, RelE/StbE family [Pleurocapsa minor HA4230-MV1]|jgi:addiction module RelE/StbE family toxin|nr:type II toxin-antitoxin system mRNA interferase toxin, RelE/StbE family [Pleurocapsa minor HA4230-MV1]